MAPVLQSSPLAAAYLAWAAAGAGYGQGPVIGIVSSPSSKHIGQDYLPKSYVDWVQAAGGRVMPLPSGVQWNKSSANWTIEQSGAWAAQYYEERFQLMNGLLLPGGNPWPQVSSHAVRRWLALARNASLHGDYFPVWGTCAGFETLMVLNSASCQAKVMDGQVPKDTCTGPMTYGWDSTNQSLPQSLSKPAYSTRILASAGHGLLHAMETQPLAANFHRAAMSSSVFKASPEISKNFHVVSTSVDGRGQDFVSIVEGITLPWYGTQWHPEKPAGEWGVKNGAPYEDINHSPQAVRLGQHMANFLVREASHSSHGQGRLDVINPLLIINHIPRPYDPKHPHYMQTYSFDWNVSLAGTTTGGEATIV